MLWTKSVNPCWSQGTRIRVDHPVFTVGWILVHTRDGRHHVPKRVRLCCECIARVKLGCLPKNVMRVRSVGYIQ
jgi:hypothetical protein